MSLLRIHKLSKNYSTKPYFSKPKVHRVLEEVGLEIQENEIFGVVGESGCGKSTLAKVITGLTEPSGGEIFYKNADIKTIKDPSSEIQMIFQDPNGSLNSRMRVASILEEPLVIHGYTKLERKKIVNDIVRQVGLPSDSLQRYPYQFSGGQRQRIGIARALVLRPKFLIADEAVSALDVSIQAQILKLLFELKKQFDLTILFISHDLSVVYYFCDRVGVMYLGEFVEIADKATLFSSTSSTSMHPYTRLLINSVPNPEKSDAAVSINVAQKSTEETSNIGCKFYNRCPLATELCSQQRPQLRKIQKNHWVRCHHVHI